MQALIEYIGGLTPWLQVAGQKVRLQGIAAPESAQSCRQPTGKSYLCGDRVTQAVRERIGTATVTCKIEGRGREYIFEADGISWVLCTPMDWNAPAGGDEYLMAQKKREGEINEENYEV